LARYRQSIRKLARNSGGTLDGYPKTQGMKRSYPSGQHGQARKKKSEFAIQLLEKQKVKRTYGVLEKQFSRYYKYAVARPGVTGTVLLQRLESRLDNIVYRGGFGYSRPQARQLISHGHVLVNGQKVDIPSYIMKPGDVITVRERSKEFVNQQIASFNAPIPSWLEVDNNVPSIKFMAVPEREEMDQSINEQLIIEFYSR
jgi:small subunit ribosomal protein S4